MPRTSRHLNSPEISLKIILPLASHHFAQFSDPFHVEVGARDRNFTLELGYVLLAKKHENVCTFCALSATRHFKYSFVSLHNVWPSFKQN